MYPTARSHRAPRLDDDAKLRDLGYHPVLVRRMGSFGNFAISFSVISVLSGCMTLYGFGLITGGPAVMMWGWVAVGVMVMFVGAGLAEVTSAYPTSGGLYYMAGQLGGRRWGWYTGWLNLLGLLGAIAGIDYGAALFTGALLNLQWGIEPSPGT
ncbi:MAG: amino acid permease, partial [Streptomyces sp.]